jgi:hypothetical protein
MEARCVALACGDAFVSFSLTLVLLIVGFIALYPVFFVAIWRPLRIRHAKRLAKEAHRHLTALAGVPFDDNGSSGDLSHAWHSRLHLDHRSGRHIQLLDNEGREWFNDGLPDLPARNLPSPFDAEED